MFRSTALIAILAIAGCAAPQPVRSPAVVAAADAPLLCKGKDQCDLYWQRALFYVNNNSRFKVQLANDSLIQTFSPTGQTSYVGYNISREPLGGQE